MNEAEKQFATQAEEFQLFAGEILDFLPLKKGYLLDVGCGLGWVVAEAQKRGFQALGIDKNKRIISVGREKLKVSLQPVSLEKFSSQKKFNVIILKHVLEHIEKSKIFLRKIYRLLIPGGYLIVSCPNMNSLMARIFLDRWYGLRPMEHRWQFTPKTLSKTLEDNNFKIEKIIITNLWYRVPGWKGLIFKIILFTADLLKLGDQVIVIAKKHD
ncbi:class I SAM-dependent methyltransferase [Candidatus Gottesmanbacteria bacterium]|nr:class I SAM-dependent methyltransferase [Candidatus Gottesmanbacteria bacterium]